MKNNNNLRTDLIMFTILAIITGLILIWINPITPNWLNIKDKPNSSISFDSVTSPKDSDVFNNWSEAEKWTGADQEKVGKDKNDHDHYGVEVYGYMTLGEVAEKYGIPVADLEEVLGIPKGKSGERLGRMKRQYGFELDELRKYISSRTEN